MPTCPNCGANLPANTPICNNCGSMLPLAPPPPVAPRQPRRIPSKGIPAIALIIGGVVVFVLILSAVVYFLCFRDKDYDDDYDDEPVVERTTETASIDEPEVQIKAGDPNGETDERFTDFSWLSNQYVNYGDISDLPSSRLRILRNAIYARHNYRFQSADLQEYFGVYDWYEPLYTDVNDRLSQIEIENIKYIKSLE